MIVKKVLIIFIIIILIILSLSSVSLASGVEDIITVMSDIKEEQIEGENVGKVLSNIIFLIQVAGTGISLIVVTILGIKYMIASVEEKAEIKKQAMPILIGCILLFGAVNLVAIVADFSYNTF